MFFFQTRWWIIRFNCQWTNPNTWKRKKNNKTTRLKTKNHTYTHIYRKTACFTLSINSLGWPFSVYYEISSQLIRNANKKHSSLPRPKIANVFPEVNCTGWRVFTSTEKKFRILCTWRVAANFLNNSDSIDLS